MTFRSVLVQAEPGEHAQARLSCAAGLADRFDATLLGLGAEALPPMGLGEADNPFAADWLLAMGEQISAELKSAEENFRRAARGRRAEWSAHRTMPVKALAAASRAADLIVAGGSAGGDRGPYNSADTGQLIMTSGRPVLVAPPTGDHCAAHKVLVAWKDCREARRASADALPFLVAAEEVLVLELRDTADLKAAQERTVEVAGALRRHGVNAYGDATTCAQDSEAVEALTERAAWFGADLIVAGGYGRTRLGEWLFGGVTRQLLAQDRLFVLFSH